MSTREARARNLLRDKEHLFRVRSNTEMEVPSQQVAHAPYEVTLARVEGRRYPVRVPVRGSCPDYRHRQPAGGCKHMIAAEAYLKRHRAERVWRF